MIEKWETFRITKADMAKINSPRGLCGPKKFEMSKDMETEGKNFLEPLEEFYS